MNREAEYRALAREAEQNAKLLSRQDERDALLDIARSWRDLADREAERARPQT